MEGPGSGHEAALAWLFGLSLTTFFGSLVAIPLLVARIPADYFTRSHPLVPGEQHWLARALFRTTKNALGLVFVAAGVTMLVLPGQGLLTITIGVLLLDFPGKRRLELKLARQPQVHRTIDWIRRRGGAPALELPAEEQG